VAVFTPITTDTDDATFGAPDRNGDEWANAGNDTVLVQNRRAAAVQLTISAQGACSLGALHDEVRTVGEGKIREVGPFDRQRFNDPFGHAFFRLTQVGGAALQDDDGQGHPSNLGVLFIRR